MAKGTIGLSVIVVLLGMLVAVIGVNFLSGGRLGFGAGPARPSLAGQQAEAGAGTFLGIAYVSPAELADLESQRQEIARENEAEAAQAVLRGLKARASDLTAWAPHWLEWCAVAALPGEGEAGLRDFAPPIAASADEWALVRCGYFREPGWRAPDNGRERWEFLVHLSSGEVIRCSTALAGGNPQRCFRD